MWPPSHLAASPAAASCFVRLTYMGLAAVCPLLPSRISSPFQIASFRQLVLLALITMCSGALSKQPLETGCF